MGNDRTHQSRAYAERATGDYLWQVDVDEFYRPETWGILAMLDDPPSLRSRSSSPSGGIPIPGRDAGISSEGRMSTIACSSGGLVIGTLLMSLPPYRTLSVVTFKPSDLAPAGRPGGRPPLSLLPAIPLAGAAEDPHLSE